MSKKNISRCVFGFCGALVLVALILLTSHVTRRKADGRILAKWEPNPGLLYEVHERPASSSKSTYLIWYLTGDVMGAGEYWVKQSINGAYVTASTTWGTDSFQADFAMIESVEDKKVSVRFEQGRDRRLIVFELAHKLEVAQ